MPRIHPQEALRSLFEEDKFQFIYSCPACGWKLFGVAHGPPHVDVGTVTFNWFSEVHTHLKQMHPEAMAFELCIYTDAPENSERGNDE